MSWLRAWSGFKFHLHHLISPKSHPITDVHIALGTIQFYLLHSVKHNWSLWYKRDKVSVLVQLFCPRSPEACDRYVLVHASREKRLCPRGLALGSYLLGSSKLALGGYHAGNSFT